MVPAGHYTQTRSKSGHGSAIPSLQGFAEFSCFSEPLHKGGIDVLGHPLCPQPLPCLIYQWSSSGWVVALTLSLCKELKEFGFYTAKLPMPSWLWQPLSLLPVPAAVLQGGLGASRGLGEQRVPVGMAGGHATPAPHRLPGQHREWGICWWQQDFSCHLLLS